MPKWLNGKRRRDAVTNFKVLLLLNPGWDSDVTRRAGGSSRDQNKLKFQWRKNIEGKKGGLYERRKTVGKRYLKIM